MRYTNEKSGVIFIIAISILAIGTLFFIAPISQDVAYHNFADDRSVLTLLNGLNVLSNIPFLLVGLYGLHQLIVLRGLTIIESNILSYLALFGGLSLVAFGSGYYHLWPNNQTLVWDRLPMTIAFMGLVCVIIGEFVSEHWAKKLLLPCILTGIASVLYWWFTERNGAGDLRFYAIVQFLPMIVIPILLLSFSSTFTEISAYWLLLLSYILAKIFEHFDAQIYTALTIISGHSIKHIFPAVGLFYLIQSYKRRVTVTTNLTTSY